MTRLLVASVLVVSSIAAATPAINEAHARAAEAFAAAENAFRDEDYPEALRLFRAAYAAAPNDVVRFNIAVCLERLGRFREAGIEYDAATSSTTLAEDVRQRAKDEAARVRARLGRIAVYGKPAGAKVFVDGVESCTLPCNVEVDPGRREVVAETAVASDRAVVVVSRNETSSVTLDAVIPPPRARGPGVLTWTGAGVTALGTGAAIYFGLRTRSLHEDYLAMPTVSTREDGIRMRDFTNISIGVAAVGALAVAIDLVFFARRTEAAPRPTRPRAALLEVRF